MALPTDWNQTMLLGLREETPQGDYRDVTPTLQYDPELGPGYFIQVRSDFIRCTEVSRDARFMYLLLLTYCGQSNAAWPGRERLMKEAAIGRPARFVSVIQELVDLGLVDVKRRGQGLTSVYYLHKLPLALFSPRRMFPQGTSE